MASKEGRSRPLSWEDDRVGTYQPGTAGLLFDEQIRLGYLRFRIGNLAAAMSSECLEAMLRCADRHLPSATDDPLGHTARVDDNRGTRES